MSRMTLRVPDDLDSASRCGARLASPVLAPPCVAGSSENARKGCVSTADFMIWPRCSHSLFCC